MVYQISAQRLVHQLIEKKEGREKEITKKKETKQPVSRLSREIEEAGENDEAERREKLFRSENNN